MPGWLPRNHLERLFKNIVSGPHPWKFRFKRSGSGAPEPGLSASHPDNSDAWSDLGGTVKVKVLLFLFICFFVPHLLMILCCLQEKVHTSFGIPQALHVLALTHLPSLIPHLSILLPCLDTLLMPLTAVSFLTFLHTQICPISRGLDFSVHKKDFEGFFKIPPPETHFWRF